MKYQWIFAHSEDDLCVIRHAGYVCRVYHNGSDYTYEIMSDIQYQQWCLGLTYSCTAEGSGLYRDCIDEVERFLDNM